MHIYVGNLSYKMDDKNLEEIFAKFGVVTNATIITDKDSGRSKGFGFIEMEISDEAKIAIDALNGNECEGRVLRVNEAQEKQNKD